MASVGKYFILSVLVAVAFAGPVKDRPKTLVPEWTSTAKLGVDPIQVKLQDLGLTLNLTPVQEIKTIIYYRNETESLDINPSYLYKDKISGNEVILEMENDKIKMNGYISKNMKISPSDSSKGLHLVEEISDPDIVSPSDDPGSKKTNLEVELLVIADSSVYIKYGSDQEVLEHLNKIIKDTNIAYKKLQTPILINLKNVHICRTPEEDGAYIQNNLLPNGKLNPVRAIRDLNIELSYDSLSVKYDSVMLWTGRKIIRGILGIARLYGSCSRMNHCGIVYDEDKYELHDVLAHELGHQLGSEHDEKTNCHGQRKLMSSNSHGVLDWSTCSVEQISSYVDSEDSYCLRIKNIPDGPILLNPLKQ